MTDDDSKTKIDSLPPVPLTDDDLMPLLETDSVVEVWVPEGRPNNVQTGGGQIDHSGDIMKVWVEFDAKFVALQYEAPEPGGGLAWYRAVPVREGDSMYRHFDSVVEDYEPLSEKTDDENQ